MEIMMQKRIHELEADLKMALLCQSGDLASAVFYAHHQLFLDQPGYAQEILRGLLDTKLAEPLRRRQSLAKAIVELEEVCIDAIGYVGMANYHEREIEARERVRTAFVELCLKP